MNAIRQFLLNIKILRWEESARTLRERRPIALDILLNKKRRNEGGKKRPLKRVRWGETRQALYTARMITAHAGTFFFVDRSSSFTGAAF